jgi:hypothetical protein
MTLMSLSIYNVRNLRENQVASIEMEETGDFYILIGSIYFMSSLAYALTRKCITGEELFQNV